ncbi:MAG: crosslink repair DNA glycosylase YcaQ family protein [Nocardioidaceae bacterium]
MTLRRQFPSIASRGQGAVVRTYERLGPVQTQVPRAAHLALASRLPGVTRDTITGAFESYQVVKASNIRGTVHTSTQRQHALLRAVAHRPRQLLLANHLALREVTTEAVMKEIERFATDSWQPRADIVAHMGAWLAARDPVQSAKRSAAKRCPTACSGATHRSSGVHRTNGGRRGPTRCTGPPTPCSKPRGRQRPRRWARWC